MRTTQRLQQATPTRPRNQRTGHTPSLGASLFQRDAASTPASILQLQRTYGNQAVQRMLAPANQIQRRTYHLPNNITGVTRGLSTMSQNRQNNLETAVDNARQWAQIALNAVATALNDLNDPNHDVHDITIPGILTGLNNFMGMSWGGGPGPHDLNVVDNVRAALQVIGAKLVLLDIGLQGPTTVVDISAGFRVENFFKGIVGQGQTRGYQRGGAGVRMGDYQVAPHRIHIDFDHLNNVNASARTIVHEATHKFLGTQDHAYMPANNLTPDQGQTNADSYAFFVARLGGFG